MDKQGGDKQVEERAGVSRRWAPARRAAPARGTAGRGFIKLSYPASAASGRRIGDHPASYQTYAVGGVLVIITILFPREGFFTRSRLCHAMLARSWGVVCHFSPPGPQGRAPGPPPCLSLLPLPPPLMPSHPRVCAPACLSTPMALLLRSLAHAPEFPCLPSFPRFTACICSYDF